jgi:uncharacterized protein (DUF2249 family)
MGRMIRKPTQIKLNLDRMIKDADSYNSKIGWFEGKAYPDNGPEVWRVASWMELGVESRSIPPRPMFAPTFTRETGNWQVAFGGLAKQVVRGQKNMKQAFDAIGLVAVGDVKKTISDIHEPKLSPLTIILRKYHLEHTFDKTKPEYSPLGGKKIGELAQDLTVDVSGISIKPLVFTGLLFSTISNITDEK